MKKRISAAIAVLLVLSMVLSFFPVTDTKALNSEYDMFIAFADSSWNYSNWDAGHAATKFKGNGHYSMTLNAADVKGEATADPNGVVVFCVDITGLAADLAKEGKKLNFYNFKVLTDGNPVELELGKIVTGDIEEKGNYRFEIFNQYGATAEAPAIKDTSTFAFKETLTVEMDLEVVDKDATTAFLMFSDRNWAFGNWDQYTNNANAIVNGSGTYTVTLDAKSVGGDGSTAASGAQVFCVDLIGYSAKLEELGKKAEISNVKISCDGKQIDVAQDKVIYGDFEENGNLRIELFNEYGSTKDASPIGDPTALSFKDKLSVTFDLKESDLVYTGYLGFADSTWGYMNFEAKGETAEVSLKGGSYSVSLKKSEIKGAEAADNVAGINVLVVDIPGLGEKAASLNLAYKINSLSLYADGKKIDVDASKCLIDDIEGNGNLRIEIFNMYGATKDASPIADNLPAEFTFADTLKVDFSIEAYNPYYKESTAFIMLTSSDYNVTTQSTDASVTTSVLGDGDYTLKVKLSEIGKEGTKVPGAQVLCVDILGLCNLMTDDTLLGISNFKLTCDGKEVPVDASKLLVGDLESLGNYRIEIYNGWGSTKDDSPIGDPTSVAFSDEMVISFTLSGTNYGAKPVEPEPEPVEYSGSYFAGIAVQSNPSYIFRNSYDDKDYGYLTNQEFFLEGLHTVGDNAATYAGTFKDVMIDGDGTYTVALNGADFGEDYQFHMIYITTGLPYSNQLTFSDVSVKINGKDVGYFKDGKDLIKSDSKAYFNIMVQNDYTTAQTDIISLPEAAPVTDIEITFTVAGMGYESSGTSEPEPTQAPVDPTPTTAPEATATTAPTQAPATPTTAPAEPASSPNTGLIIGICCGAAALIAAAVIAVVLIKKKKG